MTSVIENIIFDKLIKMEHCLIFDNAPSFKRTIYISNYEDIVNVIDQHYMAFTYDKFYSSHIERLSKAFIKVIDCDCNSLDERIQAINYYSDFDKENFICAVYNNSKITQARHKYGFHIFYRNNFETAKQYIIWKKHKPFSFIDDTWFYSCVKNPFNRNFILKDSLIVEDDLF